MARLGPLVGGSMCSGSDNYHLKDIGMSAVSVERGVECANCCVHTVTAPNFDFALRKYLVN